MIEDKKDPYYKLSVVCNKFGWLWRAIDWIRYGLIGRRKP